MLQGRKVAAIGFAVAGVIAFASYRGLFESFELGILDQFSRWQASPTLDKRILVVTIDEQDIANVGQWPVSDQTLSQLLRTIGEHNPASVGVDLYRNLPIEPGAAELIETFHDMPMIIGAERAIGEPVPAHSVLSELNQTAIIDLIVDNDGRVRRGLLSVILPEDGSLRQGIAATLALDYLATRNIFPEVVASGGDGQSLRLGKSTITRFRKNDGGYVDADHGGFQVLMNYRSSDRQFESISMTAVLNGELTDELVRDRIVLIGSTAASLNDLFYTPLDREQQIAGVYVHAHIVSQLLGAALDGRPFMRTVPDYAEWLWVCGWIAISVIAGRSVYGGSLKTELSAWQLVARFVALTGGLGAIGFVLFLNGWWLPIALPFVAMMATVGLGVSYRNQQLQTLAAYDELTKIANRRYFDQYLEQFLKTDKRLSLILCDVDHFKAYNDLYGHPAGDRCLYQVAQAIKSAVRDADMVARYGGEEFVVVLPNTDELSAEQVAQRIRLQVRNLEIVHDGSSASRWVTLSGGYVTRQSGVVIDAHSLVECADKALYEAKEAGRDRIVLRHWYEKEEQLDVPPEQQETIEDISKAA
ncbi:MAG: CHASE2 domain-containing protein [Cyanobacteria bacterium J06581_3]